MEISGFFLGLLVGCVLGFVVVGLLLWLQYKRIMLSIATMQATATATVATKATAFAKDNALKIAKSALYKKVFKNGKD